MSEVTETKPKKGTAPKETAPKVSNKIIVKAEQPSACISGLSADDGKEVGEPIMGTIDSISTRTTISKKESSKGKAFTTFTGKMTSKEGKKYPVSLNDLASTDANGIPFVEVDKSASYMAVKSSRTDAETGKVYYSYVVA